LSKFKIYYLADKVHVHHWPKNSPTGQSLYNTN